ncbi:MAG TPA: OmpW family outer membrane protein [Thermoanaerobaculia bacterium]|nr:OmpW family outer membrane protein [Thermoanaerobaculia bacterium]
MTRRIVAILILLAAPALAQTEIGARYIATSEQKTDSIELHTCQGFAAFGERFWSDRFSLRLEARFLQPAAFVSGVDLGTLGVEPVALTMRYHLAPNARFSPYAGAGVAYVRFGDLDDQFGDDVDITFDSETAFVGEAGVRLRLHERISFDFGVTYMPVDATPLVHRGAGVALPDKIRINPIVLGGAASWRF